MSKKSTAAIDIGISNKDRKAIADGLSRLLADTYTLYLKTQVFPIVDKAHDEASADLLTQRMQLHEKTTWMLRSPLQ